MTFFVLLRCKYQNMKPQTAFLVFFLILLASVAAGVDSLMRTDRQAQCDVNRALALTLRQCEPDRIDADTIRVYRSHLTMMALRDTASLSLVMSDDRRQPTLSATTGLTLRRLWTLSDQRASGLLASLAALWLALSLWLTLRRREVIMSGTHLGTLCYDEQRQRFVCDGRELHFTPMQHSLMEQFLAAPDHRLSQQAICDHLWPKKPDASATLYTLIRRLKPILDDAAGLKIACNRGDSYQLIIK